MTNLYVQADLNDKASLVKAMTGAAAAFTVTNYWEKMDMDLEIQQGKNLADAAKEAGVNHYIWSSLLNINKRKSRPMPHPAHSQRDSMKRRNPAHRTP